MLHDLYAELVPTFSASTQKDLKTAVTVVAKALGFESPQSCPAHLLPQSLGALSHLLDPYLQAQGKSEHTIRNVKNNLSRLLRSATAKGLFQFHRGRRTRQFDWKQRPYRHGGERTRKAKTYLVYAQWPEGLKEDFEQFKRWAITPMVPGRDARLQKREYTISRYQKSFEGYFGFLHHVKHINNLRFKHLFEYAYVQAFTLWHIDYHQTPTVQLHQFLKYLLAITRQYRPQPKLRQRLKALKREIPTPPATYDKNEAWVSSQELREVGEALWPTRSADQLRSVGTITAGRAGLSLMFQLWVYIPYRARNICEMELEKNLYQDRGGRWRIRFLGEQLKIGRKRGNPNHFELPFPPALVPTLEAYLSHWRPHLLAKATTPERHVFLNALGRPHAAKRLANATGATVYEFTGKRWHPHMIRTVWATEMIRAGVDLIRVAEMMNDTLETIVHNYAHVRQSTNAEEIYALIDRQ